MHRATEQTNGVPMTTSLAEPVPPVEVTSSTAPASAADLPSVRRERLRHRLWITGGVAVALGGVAVFFGWIGFRLSHSQTNDAFVEAHIVNVAPETVSGHIVRFLVEENDHVEQGQVLAEIDPVPYRDKVELARSKVEGAEAELRRQQASLVRIKAEVPIQIEIAKRTLAAAQADEARTKEALRLTTDEVEHGISEAKAGLELAQANLVMAQQDYQRFGRLYKEKVETLQRFQETTQSRDVAQGRRGWRLRSSPAPRPIGRRSTSPGATWSRPRR